MLSRWNWILSVFGTHSSFSSQYSSSLPVKTDGRSDSLPYSPITSLPTRPSITLISSLSTSTSSFRSLPFLPHPRIQLLFLTVGVFPPLFSPFFTFLTENSSWKCKVKTAKDTKDEWGEYQEPKNSHCEDDGKDWYDDDDDDNEDDGHYEYASSQENPPNSGVQTGTSQIWTLQNRWHAKGRAREVILCVRACVCAHASCGQTVYRAALGGLQGDSISHL